MRLRCYGSTSDCHSDGEGSTPSRRSMKNKDSEMKKYVAYRSVCKDLSGNYYYSTLHDGRELSSRLGLGWRKEFINNKLVMVCEISEKTIYDMVKFYSSIKKNFNTEIFDDIPIWEDYWIKDGKCVPCDIKAEWCLNSIFWNSADKLIRDLPQ